VNVTKFGAFVNILPGRDGLLHISKLGRGKRVERVEDVLNLGDEVTVRVDDIDNSGKLSLSLAGDEPTAAEGAGGEGDGEARAPRAAREPREPRAESDGDVEVASFDSEWDSVAREEFGDLGPATESRGGDRGGDRGGERRGGGGRGGRRGGSRR